MSDDRAESDPAESDQVEDEDPEELASRKVRLEAAKRSYRATLRNEAEAGGDGFTEDHYRSQKPPHW